MSNYSRGAKFERRVQDSLGKDGWFVVRSAGSHSLVDLVALRGGEVRLIQCKIDGELTKVEKEQLCDLTRDTGYPVFIYYREGRKIKLRIVKEVYLSGNKNRL